MNETGIYKIICTANGKIYIGSATNISNRWSHHRHLLTRGKHNSIHLQRAWDKYGSDAFICRTLELVEDKSKLIEREQHYFDVLMPFGLNGYNIARMAGRTEGVKRSPEQIEKMAARFRGKKLSAEHRKKLISSLIGRKHSDATKEKMRAYRLKNNPQRGKPLTERQKMALHKSGKEHPWYGRKHSPETIQKLSISRSVPVVQIFEDGTQKLWRIAKEAAAFVNLRSPDSIYRAVCDPKRKAAGCYWRRVTDRAIIS